MIWFNSCEGSSLVKDPPIRRIKGPLVLPACQERRHPLIALEPSSVSIEAGQDFLHMRMTGRGSRQDGPHLDAVADRLPFDTSVQSLASLWTTGTRCRCLGQLQPLRVRGLEVQDAMPSFPLPPGAPHPWPILAPFVPRILTVPTSIPPPLRSFGQPSTRSRSLPNSHPPAPPAPSSDSIRALFPWTRAPPVRLPQ